VFGFSFFQLYFLINLIYTMILFIFYHSILIKKIEEKYKEWDIEDLSNKKAHEIINIFYIIMTFIGSIMLFCDFVQFLFNRKNCLWLYHWKNK